MELAVFLVAAVHTQEHPQCIADKVLSLAEPSQASGTLQRELRNPNGHFSFGPNGGGVNWRLRAPAGRWETAWDLRNAAGPGGGRGGGDAAG